MDDVYDPFYYYCMILFFNMASGGLYYLYKSIMVYYSDTISDTPFVPKEKTQSLPKLVMGKVYDD